ncbi:MAG: GNAT family N-acetyltransferase [Lysobacter sp.]|nr:GNAT family N-acetyltransferase [Lysobacter sp.]
MSFTVTRYDGDAETWDAFVRNSRNGTFLLERGFMDYHADRFHDHSVLLRDGSGQLAALLPANEHAGVLHSHGGLTYGGLVLGPNTGVADAVAMLDAVRAYLRDIGFARLHYKTIPWIYHRQPAEDDRYALFRADATLVRRDVLSVVGREDRLCYQERRNRGVKSARRASVEIAESTDYTGFWPLLDAVLRARHGVAPVHALAEIEHLHARFPDRIRLFIARHAGETVAGVVVFETTRVAHVQYIAVGDIGRQVGALDAIFDNLLVAVFPDKPWFDFGISNEDQGRTLNVGLVAQKEGFGARAVAHDHYTVECGPAP